MEFASYHNKTDVSYAQQKSYITISEWWLLLPSRDFTCSKSTIETIKTIELSVKFV